MNWYQFFIIQFCQLISGNCHPENRTKCKRKCLLYKNFELFPSYLTEIEINILEGSSSKFEVILDSVNFWERKIRAEFWRYSIDLEKTSVPARQVYWDLRYLGHLCTSNPKCYGKCRNCFGKTCCVNIKTCLHCKYML